MKNSIIKVQWKQKDSNSKWKAQLYQATSSGFTKRGLEPGRKISVEITNERRCTGYTPTPGKRTKCPEYTKIKTGSQCPECRAKDIYTGYVRGEQNDLNGKFSVYLAQIGQKVKVGVTRKEKIPERWIEQGADYATEINSDLSSNEALRKEDRLTDNKITQRIRKRNKIKPAKNPEKLEKTLEKHSIKTEIIDVQKLTIYPRLKGKFKRKGLFEGEIQSVKGQIISNGRMAMAMTSGKVMKQPQQKGLHRF